MSGKLNVLTYTSLFPNTQQPRNGIFIERRLRHLLADCPVLARVVAPIPWFPWRGRYFGTYALFASVPRQENLEGLEIWHPPYLVIPKISWYISPLLLYAATRATVQRLHQQDPVDVIDAHFFYPDGVAAVLIGRALRIPVCISARGSDLTLMPDYALPRQWIRWAAQQADGLVTVCAALRRPLMELGIAEERITVLRNGVDLDRFKPGDRTQLRDELGLRGTVLLSVGNLIELKGHHLIIEALPGLPGCTLLIIGEGPDRRRLEVLAEHQGVADRVHFLGLISQAELPRYYSSADILVLASSREGWANVLLEAMACGTPVVATRVWGTPEVVARPAAGILIEERSARGIAEAIERLRAAPPDRVDTRRYAEEFSWEDTSRGQFELFERIRAHRMGFKY